MIHDLYWLFSSSLPSGSEWYFAVEVEVE